MLFCAQPHHERIRTSQDDDTGKSKPGRHVEVCLALTLMIIGKYIFRADRQTDRNVVEQPPNDARYVARTPQSTLDIRHHSITTSRRFLLFSPKQNSFSNLKSKSNLGVTVPFVIAFGCIQSLKLLQRHQTKVQ